MSQFPLHTTETAPDPAKPLLAKSIAAFGMIPNLHAVMAGEPPLLDAYQQTHTLFQQTSLSVVEQTVVWQTINVENACHYCVPAHTLIAKNSNVPDDVIEALRNGTPLADPKLEALRVFSRQMLLQRGDVSRDDLEAFYGAGYDGKAVLAVILGIAQKVMSNFTNAVAETPVDAPFQPFAWNPVRSDAA